MSEDSTNAFAYYGLGLIFKERKQYRDAINNFKKCINYAPDYLEGYTRFVDACIKLDQTDEAQKYFKALAKVNPKNSRPLFGLGLLEYRLYNYSDAIEYFEQAGKIAGSIGDKSTQAGMILWISVAYDVMGKPRKALEYARHAYDISEEIEDIQNKKKSLNALGNAYFGMRDYTNTLLYFKAFLDLNRKINDKYRVGMGLGNIGAVYLTLGENLKALEYLKEALKVAQEVDQKVQQHNWLSNIGIVYMEMENYPLALDYLQRSKKITGMSQKNEIDYAIMGEIHAAMGNHIKAMEYYETSLDLSKSKNNQWAAGYTTENIGLLYQKKGDYKIAQEFFKKALDIGINTDNPEAIWSSYDNLAQSFEKMGDYDQAMDHYELAIKQTESKRLGIQTEELQASFMEEVLPIYHNMISFLVYLGQKRKDEKYLRDAFNYAEKAKARAMLDLLAQGNPDMVHFISPELLLRKNKIDSQLVTLQSDLRIETGKTNPDTALLDSINIKLENVRHDHADLFEEIAIRHPAYGYHGGRRQPYTLKKIQKSVLKNDQILLEYVVTDSTTLLFVVRTDTFHVKDLKIRRADIEKSVTAIHRPLNRIKNLLDIKFDIASVYDLYKEIFSPVEEFLDADKKLIIIPDGILYYLPFEALVTQFVENSSSKDDLWYSEYANVEYLLEKYSISYSLSANLLDPELQSPVKKEDIEGQLFAVGNPLYSGYTKEETELRGSFGWNFDKLKFSTDEVKSISKILGESRVLTDSAATEKNVKAEISGYNIIHLSAHGLLDESQPLYSGIALTQETGDDGILQAYEILNMKLNADLVTLSSCATGLGKLKNGEGMLGLSRSFIYAGAKSIVMSLWSVHDQSTTELMKYFYQYFKDSGNSNVEALRQAKIMMIKTSSEIRGEKISYAHPFFWAPFVLIGDPEITFSPRTLIPYYYWIIGTMVLILFIVWIFIWRKKISQIKI
jgi:CHAT domain-containing protein/Tfp pilus assembly protein PilF